MGRILPLAVLVCSMFTIEILCAKAGDARADQSITITQTVRSAPEGGKVFFAMPRVLDLQRPLTVVVYFHGLLTNETFEEMLARQRVGQQVIEADVNAILVAPLLRAPAKKRAEPFAKNGAFKVFLRDAIGIVAATLHVPPSTFANARIVVVAYSGGHRAARMAIARGGVAIDGIVLLDAHYGSQKIFVEHAARMARRHSGFFVSAYTHASRERGEQFEEMLKEADVSIVRQFPNARLADGMIVVVTFEARGLHYDFVTSAWTENPITDVLKKAYE